MMNILRNILPLLSCILLISCTSMLSKKNEEYDFKCLNYSRHIEMNYQNGKIKFSDPVLQEIRYNECMRK